MKAEVVQAGERLMFLLKYATLPGNTLLDRIQYFQFHYTLYAEEDIRLNSQMFNWPAKMDPIFEVSIKRLTTKRDKAESEMKDKLSGFEELLTKYQNEVDMLREKDVSIRMEDWENEKETHRGKCNNIIQVPKNVEEIEKVVVYLNDLTQKLEEAKATAMVSITCGFVCKQAMHADKIFFFWLFVYLISHFFYYYYYYYYM